VKVTFPVLDAPVVFAENDRITSCIPFSPEAGDTVSQSLSLTADQLLVAAIVTGRIPSAEASPAGWGFVITATLSGDVFTSCFWQEDKNATDISAMISKTIFCFMLLIFKVVNMIPIS
jgi:hypothetical protein